LTSTVAANEAIGRLVVVVPGCAAGPNISTFPSIEPAEVLHAHTATELRAPRINSDATLFTQAPRIQPSLQ
jgi:hypothetical protein